MSRNLKETGQWRRHSTLKWPGQIGGSAHPVSPSTTARIDGDWITLPDFADFAFPAHGTLGASATVQGSSEVAARQHDEGGSLLRPDARSPRCGCKELTPGAARVIDMESNQVSRLASWCYRSLETWIACGEKATLLGKDVEPRPCAVGNGIAVSRMDQVPGSRGSGRRLVP
jgi:hypothetical protein